MTQLRQNWRFAVGTLGVFWNRRRGFPLSNPGTPACVPSGLRLGCDPNETKPLDLAVDAPRVRDCDELAVVGKAQKGGHGVLCPR
jgi:hypothetical protein